MIIFPAIDLRNQKVVRLIKGDYNQMTEYSDNPLQIAKEFKAKGAAFLHVVDLDGALDGNNPNFEIISNIAKNSGLSVEVGGGIRNEDIIKKYLENGVIRVILGTIAITNPLFVSDMVAKYGDKIAVGVDILNGNVATHGWTKVSDTDCFTFIQKLQAMNVKTVICTDISKDGLLQGTNLQLYSDLSKKFNLNIIASGGVSTLNDIKTLSEMNLYGAILGKALYNGNIKLEEALRVGL